MQSHSKAKLQMNGLRRKVALICLVVILIPGIALSQIDRYEPDTVRILPNITFSYSCDAGLRAEIPIYMFTDYFASVLGFEANWTALTTLDSVIILPPFDTPTTHYGIQSTSPQSAIVRVIESQGVFPWPYGGECARLVFGFDRFDTPTVSVPCSTVYLANFFEGWSPTVCEAEPTIILVAPTSTLDGDADLSGIVSISDAVFVISYIFAGGCEPFIPNSGDVNGDCVINITDAVYLIQYIFAGGNAPQEGCVVR